MSDCIFCKIINKEIPSSFVYEDEDCVVFKDIHPKTKTHLLVVPKMHIESIAHLAETHTDLVGKLFLVCKKVADQLGLPGYNLQVNVGKDGGQEVFHLHIHLMSRF